MSIVLSMLKQLIATRVKKPDAEAILQSLKGSVSGGPAPPVDPADLETVLEALPALRRLLKAKLLPLEAPSGRPDGGAAPGLLIDLGGACVRPEIREVLERRGEWRVIKAK
jgi:hypothetical protein